VRICCDCVHYVPTSDDAGVCKVSLPFWVRMKPVQRVVSDGDGTECQAFITNPELEASI
jgi:hypothetical protein